MEHARLERGFQPHLERALCSSPGPACQLLSPSPPTLLSTPTGLQVMGPGGLCPALGVPPTLCAARALNRSLLRGLGRVSFGALHFRTSQAGAIEVNTAWPACLHKPQKWWWLCQDGSAGLPAV